MPGKLRRSIGAAAAALTTLALLTPAQAQTIGSGNGVVTGDTLLFIFLGSGFLVDPNSTDGSLIDMGGTAYSYIANPYIGVTLGVTGSFTVNWGDPLGSYNHESAGMISIGNRIGSRLYTTDDMNGLVGLDYPVPPYEIFNGAVPLGYGVWPIPAHWEEGTGFVAYDYSAYMRVELDGEVIPILGGDGTTFLRDPQFVNGVLTTDYDIGNNVLIRMEVRLFRATAQFRWIVINNDTAAHTVQLRWTVPVRPGLTQGSFDQEFTLERTGFFFESPGIGLSNDFRDLIGAAIPDTLEIYGKRYSEDDPEDPPFAAQFRFRDFGATPPTRLQISNPFEMRPENGEFNPVLERRVKLNDGITVAAYYGPLVLQPGGTSTVVTYYGNGHVTERPDVDQVVAAEGTPSLSYNTAAAVDPAVVGNNNADPQDIGARFLAPNIFQVWGGMYNRVPSDPQLSLNLNNVRATLTVPVGLALANRPDTNTLDTAEKEIGTVNADRGADVNWYVRPTAERFGPVAYQVNFSSTERGARQVSRTLNIPVVPFHPVTPSSFQMIGFPFEFDPIQSNNGDPNTVVNGLTSPVDEPVAFYRWVPDPTSLNGFGRYELVTQLVNGEGYFYRPNLNRTIFAKGVSPLPGQATTGSTNFVNVAQRQVVLRRGWNIISNPYVFEIPIQYLRFVPVDVNGNPTAASQNYVQAVNSQLVRSGVFFYDTNTRSYDFLRNVSDTLVPWEGYWLYVSSDVAVIYAVPVQKNGAVLPTHDSADPEPPTRKRGMISSGSALKTIGSTQDWRLQLVASRGDGRADRATILGMTGASAESQRVMPKPPAPVEDFVYVGIVRPNAPTRYAMDLKSFQDGRKQTWELEVSADKDGPVTLTWPNVANLPRRVSLSLKDEATGRAVSLRSSSAYTVQVRKGTPTRLVVTAQLGTSQPVAITGLRMAGGGTRATGTSRSFVFNLNRDAAVTGVIKTLSGKTVATFATTRAATAGETRLTWTGRAQDGAALPPGSYRVEITATTDEGGKATAAQVFVSLQ